MAREILYIFTQAFTGFFYAFAPPPPRPHPQSPKDIALLMASPLKRKVNKFPYGILD